MCVGTYELRILIELRMAELIKKDLLYPELSYQIIGVLFEVSNVFGSKYQERYYQQAIAESFRMADIKFREQFPVKLMINNSQVSRGLIDFVVEDKVALEIKRGERFLKSNIDQLYSYLRIADIKLGILANFTSKGLQFKRVVNIMQPTNYEFIRN